jgi:hypothetical protein
MLVDALQLIAVPSIPLALSQQSQQVKSLIGPFDPFSIYITL